MPKEKKTTKKKQNSKDGLVAGILRVHPRGFGFLQPDDKATYPQDVFVPRHLTFNAVDGDRVEVEINQEVYSDKGPEGRVLAILERSRTHVAGIIRAVDSQGQFIAYVPLLGEEKPVIVDPLPEGLAIGDRVVIAIDEWGSSGKSAVGRASHLLGHITDPSKDIDAAIEEFELPGAFPTATQQEAERFGSRVLDKALRDREDFRDWTVVTIDPATAKDFDDAISLTRDSRGRYHLGVHIADVSHYVAAGSALDEEAYRRCNSTYFPGRCVPMLPPELSDNLCSLKPKVNRLTASVLMTFDAKGTLKNYRICRGVIRSAKRFSYEEAKEVLDGAKKSPHKPLLELMVELCRLLKQKRFDRGGVEFSIPELVVDVDKEGVPQGTHLVQYDITHQMIEEFMLKANEVVAQHLTEHGKGLTYRVHETPAEENLREFAAIANAFGFKLSDQPTPGELQKLFAAAEDSPYGSFLATSYIRSMRLAVYSPENIGHYGLCLEHYCHFTSPIRRYVDLVVHRILFGDEAEATYLDAVAKRCSDQERLSAKAESNVVLLKKLRLLETFKQQSSDRIYTAVITKVKPFGFHFEILDIMLEGFMHISKLSSDYYIYEESRMRLRGRHTNKIYHSGDAIDVELKEVDLIVLTSTWNILEEKSPSHRPAKRMPSKKDKKRKQKIRKRKR